MRQVPEMTLVLFLLFIAAHNVVLSGEIDMTSQWDSKTALENPHKGWYHHYPDNHVNKYIIREDAHLLDFPGMDHLYLRLPWAYLEPREGRFNWNVIDDIINKWTRKGLKIAFRISCKETGTDRVEQQYATPKWVMEAGCKGDYYRNGKKVGPKGPWEPVFDDPVFLAKLENFLRAFGGWYDGKPWLRYVDIGSIGDWGEGHTHSGSRLHYGYESRKKHVDLYRKYFRKSQLIITDDFVYSVNDKADREKLHRHILGQGISYRDDSILVDYYIRAYSATFSVRSPEWFQASYKRFPTVLELQHYRSMKRLGNWPGKPGSSILKHGKGRTGPDMFRGALTLLRPTYLGYHGDAHDWLTDNPELTRELLNKCGYWYFLHGVRVPEAVQAGAAMAIGMDWENRGVAPAYHPYTLIMRFEGPMVSDVEMDAGNRDWMPQGKKPVWRKKYAVAVPEKLVPGRYALKFKLYSKQEKRDVLVALKRKLLDKDNFYLVTTVIVR